MDYKNSKAPKNTVTREINQLTEGVGNVYETVAIIAKRANQISVGIKKELDAKLQDFSIPQDSLDETFENKEQIEIFKRKEAFTLILIVKNEAGSVARAITTIGDFGFNMRTLRSRPQKTLLWSYYFYVEGEGDLGSIKGVEMLRALEENCESVKVLGNYPADVILE